MSNSISLRKRVTKEPDKNLGFVLKFGNTPPHPPPQKKNNNNNLKHIFKGQQINLKHLVQVFVHLTKGNLYKT